MSIDHNPCHDPCLHDWKWIKEVHNGKCVNFRQCQICGEELPVPNPDPDPVNHPAHYTAHPSGIECIIITEHMNFCLGNAVKYIWRASLKGNAVQDLEKARWYITREIKRLARK